MQRKAGQTLEGAMKCNYLILLGAGGRNRTDMTARVGGF